MRQTNANRSAAAGEVKIGTYFKNTQLYIRSFYKLGNHNTSFKQIFKQYTIIYVYFAKSGTILKI